MQSGVMLILLSMSLTPFGDALSKQLGEGQSPFLIVFLRYFVAGLMALVLAGLTGTRLHIPKHDRVGTVLRTGLVMGAMTLLIVALSMTPLANAVGGFLIAPIVATIISVIRYGERLTLPRVVGSVVSLLGAVLILRPDTGLERGIIYALSGGVLLGMFLSTTRAVVGGADAISNLAVQCLLGSALLLPLALPAILTANSGAQLVLPALGLGFVTAATHFLTVAAYQRAESARLAPFFYFNLVAAVVVGVVWFHEIPGWITFLGLICIVAGGLLSLRKPHWTGPHLAVGGGGAAENTRRISALGQKTFVKNW